MVSGYDKQRQEDQYQPDFGGGGPFIFYAIVAVMIFLVAASAFG